MRRAAVLIVAVAAVAGAAGCGGADDEADPFADRGDAQRERVATVVPLPDVASGDARALRVAVQDTLTGAIRGQVARGRVRGPLLRTDCDVAQRDGAEAGTVFDCLAVRAVGSGSVGIRIGTSLLARADREGRRLAWCFSEPIAGEGATPAPGKVRPPARACGGPGATDQR